jgi:dTDP-4-dehydrorhamnose reductase
MASLSGRGRSVTGTGNERSSSGLKALDIRDPGAVERLFREFQPAVTYLSAAMTNVDRCETNPGESWAVNVAGTGNVVKACSSCGSRLVFVSSDYIFDGLSGPYAEDFPARPISEYGRQKLAGEHIVATQSANWVIVRTTVVYGWEAQGKNFVQRLVASLKAGQRVRVPKDQVGSPTYAPNLADAMAELGESGTGGVFNIAGPELASRHDFAVFAAGVFGLDAGLIDPVETGALGQAAPRPLKAGMLVGKAQSVLRTRLMGYREALPIMATARGGVKA